MSDQNIQKSSNKSLSNTIQYTSFYFKPSTKIRDLAWNSSGKYIATTSIDKTITIWYSSHGAYRECAVLTSHNEEVQSIIWHPQKSHSLYSGSYDCTICFWETDLSNPLICTIKTNHDNSYLAISPNGNYLLSISNDNIITLIDINKQQIIATTAYNWKIYHASFSPNSEYIFLTTSYTKDGYGYIDILSYDKNTLSLKSSLLGHISKCDLIDMSPDGLSFATSSNDCYINLWDLNELVCFDTLPTSMRCKCLKYNCTGHYLAATTKSQTISIFNMETKQEVLSIKTEIDVNHLIWNHTNPYLFAYIDTRARDNNKSIVMICTIQDTSTKK